MIEGEHSRIGNVQIKYGPASTQAWRSVKIAHYRMEVVTKEATPGWVGFPRADQEGRLDRARHILAIQEKRKAGDRETRPGRVPFLEKDWWGLRTLESCILEK
ncbi:hypothetical protein CONPUDRAFT_136305 [Coniophora puteana RWD-64-598 SS2]|uniref:Uncharacterized protein n=1 Tax=Coniophora puteana (strain RWD-64-598) TaxID=741705 RepID=A0A5M3MX27_CONPW|nr:uncharacterized protein CONPUDRAFT_136305 [Coniophora puteana RWD-64-598 SS2]EIW83171.1 hypothetical protein CONPUDRAFT_136305 [Coniophora puteana RWD-64-598 SS2]